MRHRVDRKPLGRTSAHRTAMTRNMVMDLFWWTTGNCSKFRDHKDGGAPRVPHRIRTTVEKARQVRRLAERLITLGKEDTVHHRRRAAAWRSGHS